MVKHLYLFAFLSLIFCQNITAQTGCPGCLIDLPLLPEDTIYLSTAPDGVAGEYYDGDISFRMPKTTTPVNAQDPGTPPGLNITGIEIISLLNVPPGLSWETNQTQFDPGDETDGCVKFCGTPLQSGLYEVEVFVTAEVSLITQSTSFSFSIYIAPNSSSTDGFAMSNSSGCGEVTVDFTNNVPSNGLSGYSYNWDFGNGDFSDLENPSAITYTEPGFYEVNYAAEIDTFGYQLTTIQVTAAGCDDFGIPPIFSTAPDLYLKIKDPSGTQIYSTDPVTNVSFPFAWNVNLMLGPGDYELEVRDDDSIGSDGCGTVTFSQATAGELVDGELELDLSVIHPVTSVVSVDTVYVFENPAPPVISPDGLVEICAGEEIELVSDYDENLQWYEDTTAILGETEQMLIVAENGTFWTTYTNQQGCQSQSEEVTVVVQPLPQAPGFHAEGNLLVLNNPDLLPADYSLQWSVSEVEVPGATGDDFCMTEEGTLLYTVEVTDNATGCSNAFSLGVSFDPSYDCDMLLSAAEVAAIDGSLVIFPNPASDVLNLRFDSDVQMAFELNVVNPVGRVLQTWNLENAAGIYTHKIDVSDLPTGVFLLQMKMEDGTVVRKFLKK